MRILGIYSGAFDFPVFLG